MSGQASPTLTCPSCERDLDRCRLCDRDDCPNPTCYRCLVFDVGQSLVQPHEHGG